MGDPAGGEFTMFEHRTVACLYFVFDQSEFKWVEDDELNIVGVNAKTSYVDSSDFQSTNLCAQVYHTINDLAELLYRLAWVALPGIAGIIGNLITIFVFCREKPLHGNRGMMHIQVAVANIMVVVGCPFSGSSAFAGRWLFGHVGCQLYGLETYTGGMGTVTFVFLLCLQRYLSTKFSDHYNTSNLFIVLSVLGWLYSIGIAIGPVLGWNSYVIESSGTACGLNWEVNDWSHRSMFIVLPVITTFMILISVFSLKVAFSTPSVESKNERADEVDWFTDNQLNWIALFNLLIVNIGFGPYGFFSIWSLFNHESKMTMIASVIPPLMAKMSSIFYPIPYLVASQRFRTEYYSRLLGKCAKRD